MKKIIASIFVAAAGACHASPVTLTATGTHVLLGSSAYDQPEDWSLVMTYDGSQPDGPVVIDDFRLSSIPFQGHSAGYADTGSFYGDVQITDSDGDVEGDISWTFGTTIPGVPTRATDLDGTSQVYAFYAGQYSEYIVDQVTFSGVSAVPEPATCALMLSGLACMGLVVSRRRMSR